MAAPRIPGLLKPGNINFTGRPGHGTPGIRNPDGSVSSVRSISITDERGRATLIPTVIPQPRGDGYYVASNKAAIEHYRESGQHLGIFANEAAATRYAIQLHQREARRSAIKRQIGGK